LTPTATDRLKGTLDLLIMQTLRTGEMHGWAIAQVIQHRSQDMLQINQGSLYPALHRLEERGWIRAEWGASESNRRARFYELTASGRRQLEQETATWTDFVKAVSLVLQPV
jgi:PadR family transcriptional regulator, regulatory protein PadR